jgi:hypothetical protein
VGAVIGRLHRTAAAGLLACLAWAVAAVAQTPPAQSATVQVSPARAGAHPVALTLKLGYEMQCGYPGPGPVVVQLPAAELVPARIPRAAVLVDGKGAPGVQVAGHAISVALPPRPQVMCDVIGPGKLTIVFTRAAGLGNPSSGGSYTVTATRGTTPVRARFSVAA